MGSTSYLERAGKSGKSKNVFVLVAVLLRISILDNTGNYKWDDA
jgi:hypothetical protein